MASTGESAAALETPLAAEAFREMLKDLDTNAAPMINALAWIALENEDGAREIAALLLERLERGASALQSDKRANSRTSSLDKVSGAKDSAVAVSEDALLATLYLIDSIIKRVGPFLDAAQRYRSYLQEQGLAALLRQLRKTHTALAPRIDKLVNLWQDARYFGRAFTEQVFERERDAPSVPASSAPSTEPGAPERASLQSTGTTTASAWSSVQLAPSSSSMVEAGRLPDASGPNADIQVASERLIQFVQQGILPPAEDVTLFDRLVQAQLSVLGPRDWSLRQYLEQLRMQMQVAIRSLAEAKRASWMGAGRAPGMTPDMPGALIGGIQQTAPPSAAVPSTLPYGAVPPASLQRPLPGSNWNPMEHSAAPGYSLNWSVPGTAAAVSFWGGGTHTASTHSHTSAVGAPPSTDEAESVSSGSERPRRKRRERCVSFCDIKRISPSHAVEQLYNRLPLKADGTGIRFRTRAQLRDHLDWVFAENQRTRLRQRGGMSRNWFMNATEWMQHAGGYPGTGFESPPADAVSGGLAPSRDAFVEAGLVFAAPASSDTETNLRGTGHDNVASMATEVSSDRARRLADGSAAPASTSEAIPAIIEDAVCPVCHEELETFYDAERDQWLWRDAVMDTETGFAFHRQCYGEGVNLLLDERAEHTAAATEEEEEEEESPTASESAYPAKRQRSKSGDEPGKSELFAAATVPQAAVEYEKLHQSHHQLAEESRSVSQGDTAARDRNALLQNAANTSTDARKLNEQLLPHTLESSRTERQPHVVGDGSLATERFTEPSCSAEASSPQALRHSDAEELEALTVRELRARLDRAGVPHRHLKRKADLVAALAADATSVAQEHP